jgi:hypothetical protein
VPVVSGKTVTNLSPNSIATPLVEGISAQQSLELQRTQVANVALATTKTIAPATSIQVQNFQTGEQISFGGVRLFQPVLGFLVYNPGTGEAYIIKLVDADLGLLDQLPNPTVDADYDPYYVCVVFLSTLTCYSMTIIIPSMVYD